MKQKLLKISGGLTLIVSLWYLFAVFKYLPQKSVDYSPSNMKSACFCYLSIELLLSIGLFAIVMGGDYVNQLIKRQKLPIGDFILDDVRALNADSVEIGRKRQGWAVRLSLVNIIIPIILLLTLNLIGKWILIVAFALVWAVIKLFTGFIYFRKG